jgi:hypothetical protein
MATIDLTLNNFILPRMSSFTPPWGTVQTDPDHAGLATDEAITDMMMPFNRMRPVIVTENSTTTDIEADASLILTGAIQSLTLGQGTYRSVELKIINDADDDVLLLNGAKTITAKMGEALDLRWNGTEWRLKTDKLVGDFIDQRPSEKSPVEKCLEGEWVSWSDRAVLYGISTNDPSTLAYVDYYSLIGNTIAIGATPVVCYHLAEDDYRLFRFKASTSTYVVPAEFDPVKWDYIVPDAMDVRESCQKIAIRVNNVITATDDLEIGDMVNSGTYAGKYITEVIVPGGKFHGVEGGNRPTFIYGGTQEGRIINITGGVTPNISSTYDIGLFVDSTKGVTGAFKMAGTYSSRMQRDSATSYGLGFDASRVVKTGPDNAPSNLSLRYWRRVA